MTWSIMLYSIEGDPKMKTLGISDFKAKCIDELKKVQKTGEPLTVTLRRQPIATINPYCEDEPSRRVLGKLKGRIVIHGDIVHGDFEEEWDMTQ
jgi:antitoxin (DNA-binding transcriptional repressor) of toxin-antitoxin stability system